MMRGQEKKGHSGRQERKQKGWSHFNRIRQDGSEAEKDDEEHEANHTSQKKQEEEEIAHLWRFDKR
jgi:hypothetical protein